MKSVNEKADEEYNSITDTFEGKKILSLNKFFMKHVIIGIVSSVLLFLISILLLIFIIIATNIDESVKISIISMVATFILTTSKTMIDRLIQAVTYILRILAEEQRGLNKKIGIDIDDVEYETISSKESEGS